MTATGAGYADPVTDPDVDARRYHRRQLVLSVAGFVLTVTVLVAWVVTGAAADLAGIGERLRWRSAVVAAMLAAVGGSTALLGFPLDVLGGFVLPRRAGLLSQSFAGWLADKAKAAVLGAVFGLLAFELFYVLLAWSPGRWWLWSAAAAAAASVVLTAVSPVWIVPPSTG